MANYKQFGIDGKEILQHDLQDKGVWCESGASKEEVFVNKFGSQLNLIINPEKENSLYVPDLLNISNNKLADLKTENTPFFQAKRRFGYDPQYTVVFNKKDRVRYKDLYPGIEIYFAVDWQVIKFQQHNIIEVKPMVGVWFIQFQELDKLLENAHYHTYQQRVDDEKGNAKGSYILNLLDKEFVKVV